MTLVTVKFAEGEARLMKLSTGKKWVFLPRKAGGGLGRPTKTLPGFVMRALDIKDAHVE